MHHALPYGKEYCQICGAINRLLCLFINVLGLTIWTFPQHLIYPVPLPLLIKELS